MYWRDHFLPDAEVSAAAFDAAEAAIGAEYRIDGDPRVQCALTPKMLETRGAIEWQQPYALLLTASCVVVAKKKLFGGAHVRLWFRYDFPQYGMGPWRGTGPNYEVRVDHETAGRMKFVFQTFNRAERMAQYFAEG